MMIQSILSHSCQSFGVRSCSAGVRVRVAGLFTVLLLAAVSVHGSMPIVFDLQSSVGDSSLIVRGNLNEQGNLSLHETFKGNPLGQLLAISDGAKIYSNLWEAVSVDPAASTNHIEVVAFLSGLDPNGWMPVMGYAGLAGLAGTNVYLFGHGKGMFVMSGHPQAGRAEDYKRESFYAAIRNEIRLDDELDALCRLPPSARRMRELAAFLFLHQQNWFCERKASDMLRTPNPDEEKELLKEIDGATIPAKQSFLLNFAAMIRLSPAAFDVVAPLIATNHPPEVRQAAIWAASRIDANKTTELLLPQLTLQRPELDAALNALHAEDPATSLKVVDVLLKLSKEMRRWETEHARQETMQKQEIQMQEHTDAATPGFQRVWSQPPNPPAISYQLVEAMRQQLVRQAHPELLTFYFDWLQQKQPACPKYVVEYLQAMLGVNWDADHLSAWWEQNQKAVNANYQLVKEAGQRQWFAAYQGGDAALRHFLVRSWLLVTATNQVSLVTAATQEPTQDSAKEIITELWHANHLGNEAIQAMFENFMKVEFLDLATGWTNRFKYQHALTIKLKFDYPFNCCIYYCSPVVIDGKINGITGAVNQVCPDSNLKEYQIGGLGGYVPGQSASTTLEVFQLDRSNGKKLWNAEWKLGPIALGE